MKDRPVHTGVAKANKGWNYQMSSNQCFIQTPGFGGGAGELTLAEGEEMQFDAEKLCQCWNFGVIFCGLGVSP